VVSFPTESFSLFSSLLLFFSPHLVPHFPQMVAAFLDLLCGGRYARHQKGWLFDDLPIQEWPLFEGCFFRLFAETTFPITFFSPISTAPIKRSRSRLPIGPQLPFLRLFVFFVSRSGASLPGCRQQDFPRLEFAQNPSPFFRNWCSIHARVFTLSPLWHSVNKRRTTVISRPD